MAEKNIKISGIGDVTREDFIRAITDPDKFKEFADQQGWGNKRRQLAWNSLHNYAQGVQNGEINEINDMHQVVDDTGARTNKKEKYNWVGSKFDANGATAAFMNQIAKGMQAASKPADKSLKSIPSVTSYLNQQWFGSNNPDWELFQKNDTLTNGVYGIADRSAKIKEGLTKYKNELTTNGAQYNWDGVDKDTLYKNLDAAIASSNVATYAPLGITSDYISNALATKDLSTTQEQSFENGQASASQNSNSEGITDEQLLSLESNKDLADLAQANPAKRAEYIAQARERLANQITLSEQEAQRNTRAYQDKIAAQKQQQYNQEMLNWYNSQTFRPEYTAQLGSSYVGTPGGGAVSTYLDSLNFSDKDFELNSPRTISAIATSTKFKKPEIRTVKTNLGNQTITLNNKLDVLAYMLQFNAKYNPNFKRYFTDVSSAAGKSAGSIYRIDALKGTDGSYVYVRKNGNNYEFYRSKPMDILYKEHLARKHKLGGIITKFQQGGAAAYNAKLKQRQQQIQQMKEKQIQFQPQQVPFGRSSVKSMGKNTNTLTTADKIAIGAAAADFLASFTANPIANGAGTILTTGADIASDISHGASFGQAAGNAAINLGMGLIGFIPGLGTATKAKKLKKILQISSGAVQAYFIANNFNEGVKSLDKVLDGSATVQDYKNLIYGLQGAKGASNSIINTAKRRGAARAIKQLPDKFNSGEARYTFKYKGKETQRLTQAQVKELQEKGSAGASDETKQLLNGVFVKPSKEKFGITWTSRPIEYQYKPKGEIQKVLDDLQIQSQKSSMWNPGRQDYLSMTSEHNWSMPNISIGFGKNSVKEVVKRAKQPPKPNVAPHTLTPEQQKRDIELLRRRFTSSQPLPIDNATRRAYEDYRKRPMTDQEIIALEKEQRAKRATRASNKDYVTYDQQNAENIAAQNELLTSLKQKQEDVSSAQREVEQAKANTQVKINLAEGNARAKDLPVPSARTTVTPESVRAQANREFALNWKPIEFKPELKGAARSKKQAMYERLFPPFAERQGTGSAVQHTTRKSLERRQKMQNAVQQEFLERQRKQNALILSPTESRQGMYQQMFSPVLTNLDNQGRASGLRAKPSRADVKSVKSSEYKQQQRQSRQQKASEVMEAFGNTKSNNIKGHNKNTNLPHKQSNKKKKTSRDNNIKRRQDGGVLYDYEFLKSVHAFKQGGVIKAQGGVKLNNIWAGKNQDYGYNTYLNRIFGNQDVLSWMRTHYIGDNATKQYADYVMKNVNDRNTYGVNNYNNDSTYIANKGINTFNTGYQNTGNTLNYILFGNNTKDYTDKKGVAYGLINFTRPAKALATGDSYNADPSKAYIDNALGLQTYSRVASLTDPGIKTGGFGDWGNYWKEQGNTGAYYYIAPGDTSGKGQWIPTTDKTLNGYQDFVAAPKKDGSVTTPGIGKKSIFDKGKEYLAKLTSNPGNLYNAVETGKYLLANKATNDIFKIKAPNYVISPKHTSYQVMDNLAQQNAYHSKAAETVNQTSRPLTSSGQLQTAAQQESMNNANKLYLQGNAERNTWLEGQKEQSYKAGLYNMENAVDTANINAQQAYKTRMINEYQDPRDRIRGLATNRQNWINALEKFNVIDPYVEKKNAQQQYGLAKAQWDYQNDANVLAAQQKYQQLLRQHYDDLNFSAYDTPEYRALVDAQKKAGAKYYNDMYQIYGISNPGFKYKKGGKFEDISKFNTKEFYNTIRHSINTATKQGGDLSKLINTLFKKSNKK